MMYLKRAQDELSQEQQQQECLDHRRRHPFTHGFGRRKPDHARAPQLEAENLGLKKFVINPRKPRYHHSQTERVCLWDRASVQDDTMMPHANIM